MKAKFLGGPRHCLIVEVPEPAPPEYIFPMRHEEFCKCKALWTGGYCPWGLRGFNVMYKHHPELKASHDNDCDTVYFVVDGYPGQA